MARLLLGGRGLGARLLYDLVGADVDPLSPENVLIIANGPLTATGYQTSNRFSVTTKSPLTGTVLDANSGGFWGMQFKKTGFDALIIRGKAEKPTDGAIHRAAGPGLLEECRRLGGCETGDAKITNGYGLPARFVIHTVGPIWQGGTRGEEKLLASCYRRSFEVAAEKEIESIAFPSISTGVYRFPIDRACRIALRSIQEALKEYPRLKRVAVVCFDAETLREYEEAAGGF